MQHQVELVELLELPELMDTCVRAQLYEEALDLETYGKTLVARHPNIPIVKQMLDEMMVTKGIIKTQLLQVG